MECPACKTLINKVEVKVLASRELKVPVNWNPSCSMCDGFGTICPNCQESKLLCKCMFGGHG